MAYTMSYLGGLTVIRYSHVVPPLSLPVRRVLSLCWIAWSSLTAVCRSVWVPLCLDIVRSSRHVMVGGWGGMSPGVTVRLCWTIDWNVRLTWYTDGYTWCFLLMYIYGVYILRIYYIYTRVCLCVPLQSRTARGSGQI